MAFLPQSLPGQPCSWRWTLGRLERGSPLRSVRVVGGLAESQLEVADGGGVGEEVCRMEGAFLTSTPPVLPWRPSGHPHLYPLLQLLLPK